MATQGRLATVISYPSKHPETGEALKFDMDYYVTKHLPMVERAWGLHCIKTWSIIRFPNPCPLTGQTPLYGVQATCYWDSIEEFKEASVKGSAVATADVPNFSNINPVIAIGEVREGRERQTRAV